MLSLLFTYQLEGKELGYIPDQEHGRQLLASDYQDRATAVSLILDTSALEQLTSS